MTDTADAPTSVFDLDLPVLGPEVLELSRAESTEQLRTLASEHWIVRNLMGFVIFDYDDVTKILRDKRWHNAVAKIPEMMGITDPEILNRPPSILAAEGDVHTRLRRLVAKAFSPRSADRLRPFMREVVNELIDPVAASGRADIAVDICEPYPIPIICELLGAPRADWQSFSRWAEDVLRIFNGTALDEMEVIEQARLELNEYVVGLIDARRNDPRADLITDLIAAEEEGDRLSTEELVTMVNAVIVGGTDTTRNQLGCAMSVFAEHPDQWRLLADRPDLAPNAVEECMRYFGAIRGTGRFASEDIVYRDIHFPAGTFVFPSLAAANADPGVTADGTGHFDITREPVKGRGQMTFGSGIHYCLGASLARAELQEALPAARPADARSRCRRRDHLEAGDDRDLRSRPLPRHVHPELTPRAVSETPPHRRLAHRRRRRPASVSEPPRWRRFAHRIRVSSVVDAGPTPLALHLAALRLALQPSTLTSRGSASSAGVWLAPGAHRGVWRRGVPRRAHDCGPAIARRRRPPGSAYRDDRRRGRAVSRVGTPKRSPGRMSARPASRPCSRAAHRARLTR